MGNLEDIEVSRDSGLGSSVEEFIDKKDGKLFVRDRKQWQTQTRHLQLFFEDWV